MFSSRSQKKKPLGCLLDILKSFWKTDQYQAGYDSVTPRPMMFFVARQKILSGDLRVGSKMIKISAEYENEADMKINITKEYQRNFMIKQCGQNNAINCHKPSPSHNNSYRCYGYHSIILSHGWFMTFIYPHYIYLPRNSSILILIGFSMK